jgi:3-hydroxyacyl-[acyl-carrier-protein] dehydratase
MKFDLVDQVLEQSEGRIVTLKQVSQAEEYLCDHFPTFPILPGVLMLEAMVQAASKLCAPLCIAPDGTQVERLVLGEVKAVKYGAMVRPGDRLHIEVTTGQVNDDGSFSCKGKGVVHRSNTTKTETAVAGRFTIRPVRMS